ncbi:hypothetical protein PRIPAC_79803 [Pristionchus pacificus]|uniref:Uncharacterized protein n=1 Tax=Pristionchus pacificus TaxID=54126 RepID=A0A2A6C358_PRIPA|nr:hypothetical protein PRIPAC_79803 [Pristionchus pacificus]|eukprot:PDM72538.1 hypothetical protein PRIPAC_38972 [Pristionchus pacificus]
MVAHFRTIYHCPSATRMNKNGPLASSPSFSSRSSDAEMTVGKKQMHVGKMTTTLNKEGTSHADQGV